MNIGYVSSDKYAPILGTSLLSLLYTNKDIPQITIFIFDDNIEEKNKTIISNIVQEFNREVHFVSLDKIRDFVKENKLTRFGKSNVTYAKIFPFLCLENAIDRILMIDCDTIINGSLEEIYLSSLKEGFVGAVPEISAYYKSSEDPEIIYKNKFYYNTGFLLWDCKKAIESQFICQAIRAFAMYNKDLKLADQSLLNLSTDSEDICPIHYKYNYNCNLHIYPILRKEVQARYATEGLGYPELNPSKKLKKKNIIMIHFLGDKRPWIKGKFAPFASLYNKYLKMSPWKSYKKESYYETILLNKIRANPRSIFSNRILGWIYAFLKALGERCRFL